MRDRKLGVELARGELIDRPILIPIHEQYVHNDDSEEKDNFELNWFGPCQTYKEPKGKKYLWGC